MYSMTNVFIKIETIFFVCNDVKVEDEVHNLTLHSEFFFFVIIMQSLRNQRLNETLYI